MDKLRAAIDHVVNKCCDCVTTSRLIKYLYLADLEFYKRHGWTLTGLDYSYYYYGPYNDKIRDCALQMADNGVFMIRNDSDGYYYCPRRSYSGGLSDEEDQLMASIVQQWRHRYFSDLMNYVYSTEPMVRATPGDSDIIKKYAVTYVQEALNRLQKIELPAHQMVTLALDPGWQKKVTPEIAQKVLAAAERFAGALKKLARM